MATCRLDHLILDVVQLVVVGDCCLSSQYITHMCTHTAGWETLVLEIGAICPEMSTHMQEVMVVSDIQTSRPLPICVFGCYWTAKPEHSVVTVKEGEMFCLGLVGGPSVPSCIYT